MEDNLVVKGHYAYMFRVDLSCNQESKLQIDEWLDKFSFSHWYGCHEIGDETGKHHYQMVVWREHKFLQKEQVKCRNWWRGKTNSKSHGAALTSARKVASLIAYSGKNQNKDMALDSEIGSIFSTVENLSTEQKKKIPKWQSKTAVKVNNLEKLESTLKSVSKTLTNYEFCEEFNRIYFSIYDRPCMHRNTYVKYLYKYKYMNDRQITNYVFNVNEFNSIPGSSYPNACEDDAYLHEIEQPSRVDNLMGYYSNKQENNITLNIKEKD